jgi:hypothetical protein
MGTNPIKKFHSLPIPLLGPHNDTDLERSRPGGVIATLKKK